MATISLLHFDEAVGSVVGEDGCPVDMAGNTLEWQPNAFPGSVTVIPSGVFGNCLANTGGPSGNAISILSFLTLPGSFITLEFRARISSGVAATAIQDATNPTVNIAGINIGTSPAYRYFEGGSIATIPLNRPQVVGDWVAFALIIENEVARVYIDGELVGNDLPIGPIPEDLQARILVSLGPSNNPTYIDELRISDEALYSGPSYTVADSPFLPLYAPPTHLTQIKAVAVTADSEPIVAPHEVTQFVPDAFTGKMADVTLGFDLYQLGFIIISADLSDARASHAYQQQQQVLIQVEPPEFTSALQYNQYALFQEPVRGYTNIFQQQQQILQILEPAEYSAALQYQQLAALQEGIYGHTKLFQSYQQVLIVTEKPANNLIYQQSQILARNELVFGNFEVHQYDQYATILEEAPPFPHVTMLNSSRSLIQSVDKPNPLNVIEHSKLLKTDATIVSLNPQENPFNIIEHSKLLKTDATIVSLNPKTDPVEIISTYNLYTFTNILVIDQDKNDPIDIIEDSQLYTTTATTVTSITDLGEPDLILSPEHIYSLTRSVSYDVVMKDPIEMLPAVTNYSVLIDRVVSKYLPNPLDVNTSSKLNSSYLTFSLDNDLLPDPLNLIMDSNLHLMSFTSVVDAEDKFRDPDSVISAEQVYQMSFTSVVDAEDKFRDPMGIITDSRMRSIATEVTVTQTLQDPDSVMSTEHLHGLSYGYALPREHQDPESVRSNTTGLTSAKIFSTSLPMKDPAEIVPAKKNLGLTRTHATPTDLEDPNLLSSYTSNRKLSASISISYQMKDPELVSIPIDNYKSWGTISSPREMENPLNFITNSRHLNSIKTNVVLQIPLDPDLLVSPERNHSTYRTSVHPSPMMDPIDAINGTRLYQSVRTIATSQEFFDPNIRITPLYNWSTYRTFATPKVMPNPLAQSTSPIVNINFL